MDYEEVTNAAAAEAAAADKADMSVVSDHSFEAQV